MAVSLSPVLQVGASLFATLSATVSLSSGVDQALSSIVASASLSLTSAVDQALSNALNQGVSLAASLDQDVGNSLSALLSLAFTFNQDLSSSASSAMTLAASVNQDLAVIIQPLSTTLVSTLSGAINGFVAVLSASISLSSSLSQSIGTIAVKSFFATLSAAVSLSPSVNQALGSIVDNLSLSLMSRARPVDRSSYKPTGHDCRNTISDSGTGRVLLRHPLGGREPLLRRQPSAWFDSRLCAVSDVGSGPIDLHASEGCPDVTGHSVRRGSLDFGSACLYPLEEEKENGLPVSIVLSAAVFRRPWPISPVRECGGWDSNPRTPKGRGPKPRAVGQAGRPPLLVPTRLGFAIMVFWTLRSQEAGRALIFAPLEEPDRKDEYDRRQSPSRRLCR